MTAASEEALKLQRSLPDGLLRIVASGVRKIEPGGRRDRRRPHKRSPRHVSAKSSTSTWMPSMLQSSSATIHPSMPSQRLVTSR
jgi:hypothetical protein